MEKETSRDEIYEDGKRRPHFAGQKTQDAPQEDLSLGRGGDRDEGAEEEEALLQGHHGRAQRGVTKGSR